MSGLFRGLQIGISSLMAHQRAIHITSQNIANMNTPGYQKQRADLQPIDGPSGYPRPPYMGNGVQASSIERFVTPFLDEQIRRQRSSFQYAKQTAELLSDVESVLTEPEETSIGANLDRFWQSWRDLSTAPADTSTRVTLLHTAKQLTTSINEAYGFVEALKDNTNIQVRSDIDKINAIASEIAGLNEKILVANAQAGGSTSGSITLEQRRDKLLFDLADITDFTVGFQSNGMVRVTLGNYALVDDSGAWGIELDNNQQPVWSYDGSPVEIQGGRLGGSLEARDSVLPSIMAELDSIASALIDNVNQIHRTGYGLNNTTGLDFFTGNSAKSIDINPVLFNAPESVATAATANSIGDNSTALQIVDLAQTPVLGGTPPTASLNEAYRGFITDLGTRAQRANFNRSSSEQVFDHLQDRRQALSGVSLDEEVAYLLGYEKAFQAGARIITVMDEMLDQVINRMGIVGR